MDTEKQARKSPRKFTPEFKAQAARLVIDEGRSQTSVAANLGIAASIIARWVRQARADRGKGGVGPLTTAERNELTQLRKEIRVLRMERDILKKATAYFARENG